MACSVNLQGISGEQCYRSKGGIVKCWIANAGTFEPTLSVSGDVITSGTTTGFKEYDFKKQTGSMTSTLNVDATNGVNFYSTELNLVFGKQDTAKRIEIAALSVGDLEMVVKDANGVYYFLGYDQPVNATAGTAETGVASTDGNKYSITFTDESDTLPYMLSEDLAEEFEEISNS